MKLELLFGKISSKVNEEIVEPAPIVVEEKPTFVEVKVEDEEEIETI